jgi:hypothetical protein
MNHPLPKMEKNTEALFYRLMNATIMAQPTSKELEELEMDSNYFDTHTEDEMKFNKTMI